MDFSAIGVEILQAKLCFAFDLLRITRGACAGHTAKPTYCGVVVMCAGVDHHVLVIVVRQVEILCIAAKTKLEDAHAGKTKTIPQRFDVRRNYSQVLCNYRDLAERFPDGSEQFPAGRRNPTAPLGGFVAA